MFALANGHIGLRANLDEGEPFGLPGTLPELVLRAAAAALRRGRLRLPGVGPDDRERHERQDHPPARRRRAVRRPLRQAARTRARARPPRRRAAAARRVAVTGRRCGASRLDAARLVRPPLGRSDPVRGRAARTSRSASSSSRSSSPTSRGLQLRPIPARRPRWKRRSSRRASSTATRVPCWSTPHGAAISGWRRAWTTSSRVRTARRRRSESGPDVGRLTVATELADGRAAPGGQVPRLRLVEPALAAGSPRRRSSPRSPQARHTGWDGLLGGQRAYLDEFWESADVELEGDTELQQAVRFALFHTLQAGARAEQRAIAAKGLTGPGYDGHTFWDTERFVLPVLTYTAPRSGGRRASLASLRRSTSRESEHASSASRAPRFRGGRSAARNARATGQPAPPPSTSAATSLTRSPLPGRRRTTRTSSARSASSCSSRRPGSGAHSVITTREGRFRIDGVTGPDEYSAIADNNVYTNLLAQRNLRAAADAVARHPRHAAAFGADLEEAAAWRDAAARHGRPMGRGARRPPPVRGLHRATSVWDFEHTDARPVPAAPPLPLLRPLPQAGRQAGRPRARPALARRRFHRRGEGAGLRLLRSR